MGGYEIVYYAALESGTDVIQIECDGSNAAIDLSLTVNGEIAKLNDYGVSARYENGLLTVEKTADIPEDNRLRVALVHSDKPLKAAQEKIGLTQPAEDELTEEKTIEGNDNGVDG